MKGKFEKATAQLSESMMLDFKKFIEEEIMPELNLFRRVRAANDQHWDRPVMQPSDVDIFYAVDRVLEKMPFKDNLKLDALWFVLNRDPLFMNEKYLHMFERFLAGLKTIEERLEYFEQKEYENDTIPFSFDKIFYSCERVLNASEVERMSEEEAMYLRSFSAWYGAYKNSYEKKYTQRKSYHDWETPLGW